jgi:hydrogenase nickel incorporation protein HypA/HybF
MHELSATQAILTRALRQASENNARRIKSLRLAIGEIAELDRNTIEKYWDELSSGTPAERAQLHFRQIDAELQCMACFQKYHPADRKIRCPHCGSFGAKVLSGEEFYLESLELES